MKLEAKVQSKLTSFLKTSPIPFSFVFELKVVRCPSKIDCTASQCATRFRYKQLQSHQVDALSRASTGLPIPLVYKISDSSIGYKPFDGFYATDTPAYLIISWLCPKKKKKAQVSFFDIHLLLTQTQKEKNFCERTAPPVSFQFDL